MKPATASNSLSSNPKPLHCRTVGSPQARAASETQRPGSSGTDPGQPPTRAQGCWDDLQMPWVLWDSTQALKNLMKSMLGEIELSEDC